MIISRLKDYLAHYQIICNVLICSCLFLGAKVFAKADGDVVILQSNPEKQLNLESLFKNNHVRILGFADKNSFEFLVTESMLRNKGFIAQIGINRSFSSKKPLSKWIYGYPLKLSQNGRILVTSENPVDSSFPDADPHHISIISAINFTDVKRSSVKNGSNVRGFLFLSGETQHLILKMDSTLSSDTSSGYGNRRLEWLNLANGKIDKTFPYQAAIGLDKIFSSPTRRYLAGLFYSEAFDPYGKSNYTPLRNALDREGYVDILNPQTGKILWHIAPTKKKPVGDPFFFISPTQFVSSDTLFDISTKTAKPWYAVTATRKCLAAVPNHASYALFVTPQGLELRDWRRKRTLRRWPAITKSGHILFSPDLKMFSFQRDSIIQFWKFDPKWLK